MQVGPLNNFLDIGGVRVGQSHDDIVQTGVTVILPDAPAPCAVDVRGGGPGTRETDALDPANLVDAVHAIVLSGGSVYGLDAASEITSLLGAAGIGYAVGPAPIPVSPIVPSAILFDNANGGKKSWGESPPFRRLAREAFKTASSTDIKIGAYGAGFGATAGLHRGGMGSASETIDGITVSALIGVNPVGSPYMPASSCFWAWPYEINNEFGGQKPDDNYTAQIPRDTKLEFLRTAGASTIIGVVGTNAKLPGADLKRVAIMAQDGIAMAVHPSHTPMDGDTIFAMSTGHISCPSPAHLAGIGAAAARCVARSIARGVFEARA